MDTIPLSDQHTVTFNVDLKQVPVRSPDFEEQNARTGAPSFMTITKSPATIQPSAYPHMPLFVTISRAVSLVLATYGIIVFSYRFSDKELMEIINYDMDLGGVCIPVLPGNVLSFIWSMASLVIIGMKKRIHPGYYIGIDLVIWLYALVTSIIATVFVGVVTGQEPLLFSATTISIVMVIPHFIVFIYACRKLDVANKKLQKDVLQINFDMKALQLQALHELDRSMGTEPVSPIVRPSDVSFAV